MNVPINETGIAKNRDQVWPASFARNKNTTSTTSINASTNVCTTSLIELLLPIPFQAD